VLGRRRVGLVSAHRAHTWRGEIHTGLAARVFGRKGLRRREGEGDRQKNARCERRRTPYYFDRVPTIYVYRRHPKVVAAHPLSEIGPVGLVEEDIAVERQALGQGEVSLVWKDALYGGRDGADGENVVLHEFAHHLDSLDGDVGGTPPLASAAERRRWTEVFGRELANLRDDLCCGRQPFLHTEAAENLAELFAYSTERFFEQPADLAEAHPELFDCLRTF